MGDDVDLQLSATDNGGYTLTYTATGLPAGLSLDPAAGTISGTISASAASATPYSVTVMASDGSASQSQTFSWSVSAVSLTSPGDQTNLDGDAVNLPLTATDAASGTLTYSATGLPPGLAISAAGVISGTLASTADANSPYTVTVTAGDGTYRASQSFQWTITQLSVNTVNDQDSVEGASVSLQLAATDHRGTPTWSATGLPAGLSLNAATGLISGTIQRATPPRVPTR